MSPRVSAVLGASGFAIFVVSLTLSMPGHVSATPPVPVVPVNVTNTPLPVNVQGTQSVSGTVAAAQSGLWNVGITGLPPVTLQAGATVTVANSAAQAVPVVDVTTSQPIQLLSGDGCEFDAISKQCSLDLVTVPAGHRLVLESVSGIIGIPAGDTLYYALILQGCGQGCTAKPWQFVVPQLIGTPGGTMQMFAFNHHTRMYWDEGQTVRFSAIKDRDTAGGFANATFSGYLITK